MFNKDNKLDKFKDAETIIGASVKVKGNFQGQGNIIVEGSLEGSLKTKANLFIGDKAKVVASIEVNDAVINGEVRGNIKAKNYLAIGPNARIFGDVQYGELSIDKGASLNGQLSTVTSEDSKKAELKTKEEDAGGEK